LVTVNFPPTVPEDLVGRDGETSGFRELCLPASFLAGVRRACAFCASAVLVAGPLGGADAMKEVLVFKRLRI